MSQVENTRPRTGQIIRPGSFNGQSGRSAAPGAPQTRDYQGPDPGYFPPGVGWQGGSECGSGCGNEQCGCGTMYGGPGHGFCWYCMKTMLVKEMACLLQTDPTLQAILNAPRMGVTDGSEALPGQVGEWVTGSTIINVPAIGPAALWQGGAGVLVVPPGDWLLSGYGGSGTGYETQGIAVEPMPPGLDNDMGADLFVESGTEETVLNCVNARGNFTQPTLLPFTLWVTGMTGGSPAAPYTIAASAWRMR